MQKILITGALGYLGQAVLKRLHRGLEAGKVATLVAMDIKEALPTAKLERVHYVQADIRDPKLWETLAKYEIDTVIHLAAIIDSQSSSRAFQYEVDVLGTKNILEACVKVASKRIIISSSGAAYGYHADNPAWLKETDRLRGNVQFAYSDHKRQVEELLASYRTEQPQLEQVIFRVCTILGAQTDNLITKLFDNKRVLGIRGYDSPYVFVWDEDVAACMEKAVSSKVTGIFNLAGDGAIKNADLAQLLKKPYLTLPEGLLRLALRIGHRLKLTQYGPDQLLFLQYRPVLDNRQLKANFGYQPQKSSLETFCYYLEAKNKAVGDHKAIQPLYPPS